LKSQGALTDIETLLASAGQKGAPEAVAQIQANQAKLQQYFKQAVGID